MQIDVFELSVIFIIVLLSMTVHEAMHAFTSYWLGDDTAKHQGRLTLNPFAHIDPFLTILLPLGLALVGAPIFGGAKPVPFNPTRVRYGDFGAALVGIAGPLTNFVIAFFAFGIYAVFGVSGLFGEILQLTVLVNLGFFIFNMLPIPPLDGSRLLYALAPSGARRAMEVIEQQGIVIVFALVLLFSSQIGIFIVSVRDAIVVAFATIFGLSV